MSEEIKINESPDSPKLLSQRIIKLYYKTLGSSVKNSQFVLSPLSLWKCILSKFVYFYRYECEECSRIVPSEEALQSHKETVHSTHKTLKKQYRYCIYIKLKC